MLVKKYSNRRLYDTEESRYITLDELAEKVRSGTDVQIVDAKSGNDLTQATLTQIILETSAKLLPVPLLTRLIRMQDDALAEFFGKYMSGALEMYLSAKQGAQAMQPYFPLANLPFSATNAFARMLGGLPLWGGGHMQSPPPSSPPPVAPPSEPGQEERKDEMAELRSELEELRKEMRGGRKSRGKRD